MNRLLALTALILGVSGLVIGLTGRDRPVSEPTEGTRIQERLVELLEQHSGAPAVDLRDLVDTELADAPQEARTYGPIVALRAELDDAVDAQALVAGGETALDDASNAMRESAMVVRVSTVEERTLPAVVQARATFRALPVPADGQKPAAAVDEALTLAVHELRTLIATVNGGTAYEFDVSPQFARAREALHDYAVVTGGNLAEAVTRLRS